MAIWNRHRAYASDGIHHDHEFGKPEYNVEQAPYDGGVVVSDEGTYHRHRTNTELHRGLHARHITMIAIGGAIGTGLIVGTGSALAKAGPGAIFIAYSIIVSIPAIGLYLSRAPGNLLYPDRRRFCHFFYMNAG